MLIVLNYPIKLFILILLISLSAIGFIVGRKTANLSSKCLNIIGNDNNSINLENILIESGKKYNETYTKNELNLLINDIIIGINGTKLNNNTNNNNNKRLLQSGSVTPVFGGNGGTEIFITGNNNNDIIKKICVRHGNVIDAIQVTFASGQISRFAGGNGGILDCFESDCFKTGNVRHGNLIDGLQFTNQNGDLSEFFGGNGGNLDTWSLNDCINTVRVRAGEVIDQIQFSS